MAGTTEIISQRKTGIGHAVHGFKSAYVISLCDAAPKDPKSVHDSLEDGLNVKHPDRKLHRIKFTVPGRKPKAIINDGKIPGHFSVAALLLPDGEIPSAVRQALLEGRRQDAAAILMHQYGLSCAEASDLLGFFACE